MVPIEDDGIEIPPPSKDEVSFAIRRLKNNKAAGADGLPAELFKVGGDRLTGSMHQLIGKRLESQYSLSSIEER